MIDARLEEGSEAAAPARATPFPFELLARSAVLELGGRPLGVDTWRALHDFASRVGAALAGVSERPARLEILGAGEVADAERAVFGAEFVTGTGEPALLTVDADAARAVVDGVTAAAAGVRGAGAPTETERGLLEYATLVVLDELTRAHPSLARAGALRAFPTRTDLRARLEVGDLAPVAVRTVLGAREGRATVWVSGELEARPWSAGARPGVLSGEVEVALALPAVTLREEELGRAAPGDVVLLGTGDPDIAFEGASLVTSTGWRLGSARLEANHATSLRCTVGALRPEPDRVPAWSHGRLVVRPWIGRRRVRLDALPTWREGTTLELEKDPDGALALTWRGAVFARAEEVGVGDELGARLLTCDRSGMGES